MTKLDSWVEELLQEQQKQQTETTLFVIGITTPNIASRSSWVWSGKPDTFFLLIKEAFSSPVLLVVYGTAQEKKERFFTFKAFCSDSDTLPARPRDGWNSNM